MDAAEFSLRIAARHALTPQITEFVLAAADGRALPPAAAGAHITVATPAGPRRRYSLTRCGPALNEYRIAVKREADGRGGSASLVDDGAVGVTLAVQPPQNDFPLRPAPAYLFIAGGIGITPILAMLRELRAAGGADFQLIYLTRDAEHSAYLDELTAPGAGGEVLVHHDHGDPARFYDLWPTFERPDRRHVYYCGPEPLLDEIAALSGHWPPSQLHSESFAPKVQAVRADDVAFTVHCRRSGLHVEVGAGESALAALRAAGVTVPSSCESGSCGSCRTTLLAGRVEHRDLVLTESERDDQIMLCVSRPQSGENAIVVDL